MGLGPDALGGKCLLFGGCTRLHLAHVPQAGHDLGLQRKEDVLHRLVDIWATGEASASMGFAAARFFDEFDPLERRKDAILAEQGIKSVRAQFKALKEKE